MQLIPILEERRCRAQLIIIIYNDMVHFLLQRSLKDSENAFQSADTTIQIGGTGGVTNTSVQNGVGRSLTSNAVIGLATVGKSWGQQAQKNMSVPTTVQVYSGTPVGVLFLQDIVIDPNESK